MSGKTAYECAQCRRDGTNQVVPGKDPGAIELADRLGECSLLDREERPDFLVAGAEHADRGDNEQHQIIACKGKHASDQNHQRRPEDEHSLAADSIGGRGDPE